MQIKKVLAAVMSLCMVAGAVSYGAPVISQTITAQAADAESEGCTLDRTTGVLTLRGEVKNYDVSKYGNTKSVKSVIAEEGTVFPEDCSGMFKEFKACTYMDLSKVDTSNVKNMCGMFDWCIELEHLDISGFDTSNVTNMCGMFEMCTNLTSLDVSGFDTGEVMNMNSMFNWCCEVKSLDVSGFDTSNVTDMGSMFSTCRELKTLDVTGFDTRKVTKMYDMFLACIGLTSLDVSSFDTSNVDNMSQMFSACNGLTMLDLSGFNTSNVVDMGNMFCNCPALTSLDLSNFDTRNVDNMHSMFGNCSGLTELDLSDFDTSKVTNMQFMFSGCSGLKTLDLSNFDTSNVYIGDAEYGGMRSAFTDCVALNKLKLGEKFAVIPIEAELPKGDGWVNTNSLSTIISGDDKFAVIENKGYNTYKQYEVITYPTNIKVAYSEKYRQLRFTWDKVEGADRYGIAVYLAGKWRIQTQNITDTVYTTPKNLITGRTYKVAIAARVNGKWDTKNAIKNAVTVTVRGSNSYVKPDRETLYGAELYVIANKITMYLGPDTSYGKVTTIPAQTMLTELGVQNDNNNWVFTEYKGQYGWVQIVNDDGKQQISVFFPSVDKPVIYLYPEKETDVHVEVELMEADLSTTYPKYNNGWDVVAKPDGTLVNKADGSHHRYLFWDAVNCRTEFDLSKGFCVAGGDTESFLKEKLSYMGLTEEEMNEFIVYWLPRMEHNKYNLISFQSEKYTDSAKLTITPTPDSMLRVFMTYVPLEESVDIEPQELSTFERSGFTVVEWGGSEIK